MQESLEYYYKINYSKCEIDESFLSSWQGLAYPNHLIQLIGSPIQILTFFIIFKKTPESMKSMKWPLLTAHFWCTFLDVVIGILITPYIFLPSISFVGVGLLSRIGIHQEIQLVFALVTVSCMNVSLIYLYESRSSSIENNIFKIRRRCSKCLYYSWNLAFSSLILVSVYNIPKNQEESKLEILKTNPCPTSEFFNPSVLVWLIDAYYINITFSIISPSLLLNAAGNVTFHAICSVYYLYIAPSTVISVQTRHIQRRFFLGIVVQTLIPTIICGIPYIIISLAAVSEQITQSVTNIIIIIIGCHGIIQSITIILVHRAYRHHVKQILPILCIKKGEIRPVDK